MPVNSLARRIVVRIVQTAVLPAFALSVFLTYRWAEHPAELPTPVHSVNGRTVTIRLENAPFTSYAEGRKTWSLHAASIDIERPSGASLGNIQSATLTKIRDGSLYRLPESETAGMNAAVTKTVPGTPAATFRADAGHYVLGGEAALPPDLAYLFSPEWQFEMTGDVVFRAASGDTLRAPSLTVLEMLNRRTRLHERRIVCDAGAEALVKGVRLLCNRARYNPADRTIECLNGAHGTFRKDTVQAERLFWAVGQQMIFCPETAAGTLNGMPFQANDLTIDLRRRRSHANHVTLQIRTDNDAAALP